MTLKVKIAVKDFKLEIAFSAFEVIQEIFKNRL